MLKYFLFTLFGPNAFAKITAVETPKVLTVWQTLLKPQFIVAKKIKGHSKHEPLRKYFENILSHLFYTGNIVNV